MVEGSVTI